ncbi:hypothetical protein HQ584_00135 [Patescibacteria group bacterium]|nr:hypothetical protein [Patescibacteria group bacterium]
MQQLRERNTYTPTVIPHDRSNCGLLLNSSEGRRSVAGLKTSLNNPDAALTAGEYAEQNLRVSAKNWLHGTPPYSQSKKTGGEAIPPRPKGRGFLA